MSVQHPNAGNSEYGSWSYPQRGHAPGRPVPGRAPGWYMDPFQPGQRWWDGTDWTGYVVPIPQRAATQSAASAVVSNSTVVAIGRHKSVGAALVLTFLLGPLGMLYSTVLGAFMMAFLMVGGAFAIGTLTLGFGDLVWVPACWVFCMIWGCAAASGSGTQVVATQSTHQHL